MEVHSQYLAKLSKEEREQLIRSLLQSQDNKCFLCQEHINLALYNISKDINIDHVIPLAKNGSDNPTNFAVMHESCNKSKQDADLHVARVLCRLDKIRKEAMENPEAKNGFGTSLADVLKHFGGAKYDFHYEIDGDKLNYAFPEMDNKEYSTNIFTDRLSQEQYAFLEVPLEYMYHDTLINPRGLNNSISKLIKEFYKKNPQLHLSLARIDGDKLKIFDGQHKAVAQIMLGAKKLPLRVFLNPDVKRLTETNKNAGDTLRQVAFDKSVMRQLNSTLYNEKLDTYRREKGLDANDYSFSEQNLVNYFRGENIKKYIIDSLKDSIRRDQTNKLADYIDTEGKSKTKPISYSTLDKTFLSLFIDPKKILSTNMDYKADQGENPRELERTQLIKLMNIMADEIYIGKFDPEIGVGFIENKLIKGKDEDITDAHLVAYRMSKEEIMGAWMKLIKNLVIRQYFAALGQEFEENSMFQQPFPDALWTNITYAVRNLRDLALWKDRNKAATIFSGKRGTDYWYSILKTGKTLEQTVVLTDPLDDTLKLVKRNEQA